MNGMSDSGKIELVSTVVGAVVTLAVGMGLSILMGGFVRGFGTMAVVSIGLIFFVFFRSTPDISTQGREHWASRRLGRD